MLVRTKRHGKGRVLLRGGAVSAATTAEEHDPAAPGISTSGGASADAAAGGAAPRETRPIEGGGRGRGPPAAAFCAPAALPPSQLVLYKGLQPALPTPRWPSGLHTSSLPYCRPAWTEGLLQARRALYSNRAIRLAAVLQQPQQLSEALIGHALTAHGSPHVSSAWRSPADVHRFLCHSEEKQSLQGPYRLRCPDTSPLVLPAGGRSREHHTTGAGAAMRGTGDGGSSNGGNGGSGGKCCRPTLAEALRCLTGWQQHRILIQLGLCQVAVHREVYGSSCGGSGGSGCQAAGWSVEFEACGFDGDSNSGAWFAACKELLSPALKWVRQEMLGRYWGLSSTPPPPGAATADAAAANGSAIPAQLPLGLPYSGGVLSLEWGADDGGLLPLRCHASDDRVVLQVCGSRRVLLMAPEHGLTSLATFPVLHPYDGYSMPAVAHTLVYDTPGVDVRRATATVLTALPDLSGVPGYVAILEPGDALFVPAGWFLHCELLPPPSPTTSMRPASPHHHQPDAASGASGREQLSGQQQRHIGHNIALVLSLAPLLQPVDIEAEGTAAEAEVGDGNAVQRPERKLAANYDKPCSSVTTVKAMAEAVASRAAKPLQNTMTARTRMDGASELATQGQQGRLGQHEAAAAAAVAVVPPSRPLAPGTALLQLSRLVESWALAVEVAPGPELRRTLLEMADYHMARLRWERRQRQLLLPSPAAAAALPPLSQSRRRPDPPECEEKRQNVRQRALEGDRAAGLKEEAEQEEGGQVSQQATQQGEQGELRMGPAPPPPPLQQWLQLRLHPTFNGFTPRGRVLLEMYDMIVQKVAPVARSAMSMAAAAVVGEQLNSASPFTGRLRGLSKVGNGSGGGRHGSGGSGCDGGGSTAGGGMGNKQKGDIARSGGRTEVEAEGGGNGDGDENDDGLAAFLRLVCESRLHPTDWVNQLCRAPEMAREQLLWYDDCRTSEEARFPELFRLQVAAKDATARLTSLRPAALPYRNLLAQTWEAPRLTEAAPKGGVDR